MRYKLQHILLTLLLFHIPMIFFTGCVKEYSYEGNPIADTTTDTIPVTDTLIEMAFKFPVCAACKETNETLIATWNFKYENYFLCGNVTNAVITSDRTAFTFFGPSACSIDTGLVMTVYMGNEGLDRDRSNLAAARVIFEYYNNVSGHDIFLSGQRQIVSLIISSYVHTTGIAKGKFSGLALTSENSAASIKEGNFEIKFP